MWNKYSIYALALFGFLVYLFTVVHFINYSVKSSENLLEKQETGILWLGIDVVDPTGAPGVFTGTGFFIDNNLILTNNHVIENAKGSVWAFSKNSPKSYEAVVIWKNKLADLALVKLVKWKEFNTDNPGYYIFKFATDKTTHVGDKVNAIGHPSQFLWTVSEGIISAKNRHVPPNIGVFAPLPYLQIDAAIYHGNSGGPILNQDGEVIGVTDAVVPINSAKPNPLGIDDAMGEISLAIPSDIVIKVVNDLMDTGDVKWPYLGLLFSYKQGDLYPRIRDFTPDSILPKIGMQKGDYITKITTSNTPPEGLRTGSPTIISDQLWTLPIGDTISIAVIRDGVPMNFDVNLSMFKNTDELLKFITSNQLVTIIN